MLYSSVRKIFKLQLMFHKGKKLKFQEEIVFALLVI